ncbi:MAG: hypothetical protein HOW71_18900 [Nonomuraea sp.]|nr:hypothetical protein [Nonomuraea sp.]
MPRSSLLAWPAALAAAVCSTWEMWRPRLEPQETRTGMCVVSASGDGQVPFGSFVTPLLGDASATAGRAMLWAIPSALVVVGFLTAVGSPARAAGSGRRVAGLLILIAVAAPLSPLHFDADACAMVPVLSGHWFALVGEAGEAEELWLLVAAALVLLATQATGEAAPASPAARRAAALAIDYLIVADLVTIALGGFLDTGYGLLGMVDPRLILDEPVRLLLLPVVVVYALTGRTFGKRIVRIEVVSTETGRWPGWRAAAVRAVVFPGLVLIPEFGLVALAVDTLWWLVDGHPLHDRLSGTTVKRAEDDLLWR